ncbi:hypothetical protein [Pseudooceanicola algae]|uniref:Uncharacterized protein n=1 Tax=Pseudooceanicola algae TaxID=1537215 RepID=A0A418SIU3_9RHOB|nr:hypothetical protein [Pseudooceanicola algae]QPM91952.1 hypothetical protein PSAL_032150 [Pseudooceanicola algae]
MILSRRYNKQLPDSTEIKFEGSHTSEFGIVFDGIGGTLQTEDFVHHYPDGESYLAAEDTRKIMGGSDSSSPGHHVGAFDSRDVILAEAIR